MNIVVIILLHFLKEEIGFVSFNYIKFVIKKNSNMLIEKILFEKY